jgi:hypothetical protein
MKPLTSAERAVFGHDAVRFPDGSVQERGIGSPHHRQRIMDAADREAACRSGAPSEPSLPMSEERTVDPRLIHPWPEMKQ